MHEEEQGRRILEPMLIGGRRTAAPEPDLDEPGGPDEAIELDEDENSSSAYSSMGSATPVQQPEVGLDEQDVVAASGVPAPEPEL